MVLILLAAWKINILFKLRIDYKQNPSKDPSLNDWSCQSLQLQRANAVLNATNHIVIRNLWRSLDCTAWTEISTGLFESSCQSVGNELCRNSLGYWTRSPPMPIDSHTSNDHVNIIPPITSYISSSPAYVQDSGPEVTCSPIPCVSILGTLGLKGLRGKH